MGSRKTALCGRRPDRALLSLPERTDVTNLSVSSPETTSNPTSKTGSDKDAALARSHSPPLWLMIGFALVLGLVPGYANIVSIWQHGTFFDSDDAMRLIEVRNLLHGLAWFDMTIGRLDPPHGVFMH